MARKRKSIAIRIEAVGDDVDKPEGIAWLYGDRVIPAPLTPADDYEWIGGHGTAQGLVTPPQASAAMVDIFNADIQTSAHDFELHADALAMGKLYSRQIVSDVWLDATLNKVDDPVFNTSPAGNIVIFVDDEAMLTDVTEFGTTVSRKQARVQYFVQGSSDEAIVSMDARGLTGQCVIGRRFANSADPGFKMIPDDGGAEVWEHASGAYGAVSRPVAGCATDATGVYVGYTDTSPDGVYAELAIANGVEQWSTPHGGGQALGGRGTAYDSISDFVFGSTNNFGNEIVEFDAGAGGAVGDDIGFGAAGAVGKAILEGGGHFVHLGSNETALLFALPWSGAAASRTIDFKAGGDTPSLDWSATAFGTGLVADQTGPQCLRDRVGSGAWICAGRGANLDEPYLFHIIDDASPVDIEIDVSSDTGLTLGANNYVMDFAVDKFGHVLALIVNGLTGGDEADIVRYDSTGAFVYSCVTDGVANLPDGTARSICVAEDGCIAVGDETGGVTWYDQL